MKVLFVNNKDSFVWNLVDYVSMFEPDTVVVPNTISQDEVEMIGPDAILISPGPGNPHNPADIGTCIDIIKRFGPEIPTLGVCLGHQCVGHTYGAVVRQADQIMHGKSSDIHHAGTGVFAGLPNPFSAVRYHSLIVEREGLPDCFEVTAWTDGGLIMGMRHRVHPVEGVQFHPESFMTESGKELLRNFVKGAGR